MNAPRSTREQRVARAMTRGLVAAVLITALAIVAAVVGRLGGSEYLRGVSVGMLATLPWTAALMMWRAYGQLDEFGRQRQTQAAAVAFIVVMLLAMTYFPLQVAASWPALPLWVLWVVGITTWGAVLVAGELRDPPLGT